MKLNIDKLQTGGLVYFSTVANPYSDAAVADRTATAASTKSSSDDDDGLISKSIMNELYKTGIPVDVDYFSQLLAAYEKRIDMGLPVSKRGLYALKAEANRVIQLANYLKTAEDRADKNESLGEVAVGARGELYTIAKNGDIKEVSMTSYDKEKDGPALTVDELIKHRKFNATQAFDVNLTQTVGTNIGMLKIQEWMNNIIKTVGESETTQEAFTDLAGVIGKTAAKKPTEQLLASLKKVYQALLTTNPDAVFKTKDVVGKKNLDEALQYIEQVMPKDMQLQLAGRYVAEGHSIDNVTNHIDSIIASALASSNETKFESYVNYDSGINSSLKGDKDKTRNLGVLEQLVQGTLGRRDYKLMNTKNPEYSLNLHGTGIGSLATFDNNIVDKTTLSKALESGLAPLVDEQHITIGNLPISQGMFDSILYNGGDVINVWAPVNADGNVDLEQLALLSEVQSICETNPQLTTEDKNALLQKYNLQGSFDEKGIYHGSGDMAQFLVMTGVTSDKIVDHSINPFADKLSKKDKEFEFQEIERIYGQLNKGVKGSGKYKFQTGLFNATTDLYRAPIFMRLNKTAQIDAGSFSNKGALVSTPTYAEQIAYDLILNSKPTRLLVTPSTQALYE